MAAPGGAKIR